MTQALTSYYPFVSAAYRKGAVSIRRSWNGGHSIPDSGVEMPDCGRLVKRHRESLERLRDGLARLLEG